MEKNKSIFYILVILSITLFFLIIIVGFLSKIKKIPQEKNFSSSSNSNHSTSFNSNHSTNLDLLKNNKKIKTTIYNQKKVVIPSLFVAEDGYGENKKNIFYIKKIELLKQLPLTYGESLIIYNQEINRFQICLNTQNNELKNQIISWLQLNGFSEEEINNNFEFKNESVDNCLLEDDSKLIATNSILINNSYILKSENQNSNFDLFFDFLEIKFKLNNIKNNVSFNNNSFNLRTQTNNLSYGIPQGYNPNARGCYTPKKFIEIYADGLTPDGPPNCYQNVKVKVYSYLVPINFLGATIRVHQKTVSYFQAVDQELLPYKIEGRKYKFKQGEYNFYSLGTYAFRCNVNASKTTDVWNVCDPGCILSPHSFGFAIDINPNTNINGSDKFDMPPEVVSAFRRYGFRWGGEWKDAMHFEYLGELCKN